MVLAADDVVIVIATSSTAAARLYVGVSSERATTKSSMLPWSNVTVPRTMSSMTVLPRHRHREAPDRGASLCGERGKLGLGVLTLAAHDRRTLVLAGRLALSVELIGRLVRA